jgi:hypothetical protein
MPHRQGEYPDETAGLREEHANNLSLEVAAAVAERCAAKPETAANHSDRDRPRFA